MINLRDSEIRAAIGDILDLAPAPDASPDDIPVNESAGTKPFRWVLVAAGLVATVGAFGLVSLVARNDQPAQPAASPDGLAPRSEERSFDAETRAAAAAACAPPLEAVRSAYEENAGLDEPLPSSPTPGPLIALLNKPGTARQVMFAPPIMFSCTVSIGGQPTNNSMLSSGMMPSTPVGADAIDLLDGVTVSVDDNGPGTVLRVGRLGSNVASVQIELEDGTLATAGTADGWFAVEISVAEGVSIEPYRFNWTLDNGTQRSAEPLDILSPT